MVMSKRGDTQVAFNCILTIANMNLRLDKFGNLFRGKIFPSTVTFMVSFSFFFSNLSSSFFFSKSVKFLLID
jgi:hypothetical protein